MNDDEFPPPPVDTAAGYRQSLLRVECAARLLAGVDLQGLADSIATADSLGSIMDPTAYRDAVASGLLDEQRIMVSAAQAMSRAGAGVLEQVDRRIDRPANLALVVAQQAGVMLDAGLEVAADRPVVDRG